MIKKLFYLIPVLLLCSSCVSRTTLKEQGLKGGGAGKSVSETKTVWFWDKDF